jgi:hypothetical protein
MVSHRTTGEVTDTEQLAKKIDSSFDVEFLYQSGSVRIYGARTYRQDFSDFLATFFADEQLGYILLAASQSSLRRALR